jgi:hypothetical protein
MPSTPVSKLLVDNLPEQAALRQIKAWRVSGWKLERIAEELNRRGIFTKLDCRWQAGNVASVLGSRHSARILAAA